jgi:hypothetical protein
MLQLTLVRVIRIADAARARQSLDQRREIGADSRIR